MLNQLDNTVCIHKFTRENVFSSYKMPPLVLLIYPEGYREGQKPEPPKQSSLHFGSALQHETLLTGERPKILLSL